MSVSASNEKTDLLPKEKNSGFFTLGRKSVFSSSSFLSHVPQKAGSRSSLQKSRSQDQPTGLVAQILQEKRDALLKNLKATVKMLAEEAVTRNYIHDQSTNIGEFCAAVESCLSFGLILHKPVFNFQEPKTFSLLKEISKAVPEAKEVVKRVEAIEDNPSGSGGIFSLSSPNYTDSLRRNSGSLPKYFWIKVALVQKKLEKIMDYLIANAESHYERVSILSHPFDGPLFADLVRGSCSHDYSGTRTSDHLWTDPSAGELMQRKMIYSTAVPGAQPQQPEPTTTSPQQQQQQYSARSTSSLRPRRSLDSGMSVASSAASAGHHRPHPADVTGGAFFLYFEPNIISPASLVNQVTPLYALSADDSGRYAKNGDTTMGSKAEKSPKFEDFPTDDEDDEIDGCHPQQHLFCQSHAVFSPAPMTQKLSQAKDYVESLHQNERAPLLYGKNNVIVQPSMSISRISGYLSMHKTGLEEDSGLQLKWAPNRAMSVPQEDQNQQRRGQNRREHKPPHSCKSSEDASKLLLRESSYWDFALDIDIKKIAYIHCHRHYFEDGGGTVILVRSDGIQYPPLTFPSFSQVISFIQCLETHLAPRGSLNPSTEDVDWEESADLSMGTSSTVSPVTDSGAPPTPTNITPTQFCFRIDYTEAPPTVKPESGFKLLTSTLRSSMRWKTHSMENLEFVEKKSMPAETTPHNPVNAIDAFSSTFQTMQHQILSRVFNGWLAYTRSINAIRTRLQNSVYPRYLMPKPPPVEAPPLTAEFWHDVRHSGGKTHKIREVYERIYFGGCDPALRREVWPFLLGHYPWTATSAEIEEIDANTRMAYERSVSEWLSAEVIVRQQQHQQQHCHARDSKAAAATVEVARPSTADQSSRSSRSRSVSTRRESQTVDVMLSEAWNNFKRRISTATTNTPKPTATVNGNSKGSHNPTNSSPKNAGLPPVPPKVMESKALKADHAVFADARTQNSIEITDDGNEDYTMTTTDEDETVENVATANSIKRLAMARAQSCPNSPRLTTTSPDNLTIDPSTIRTTRSSGITHDGNSDLDDVFEFSTGGQVRQVNGNSHHPPVKERKQSRYSRAEISGATYSSEVLEALSVNIQRIDKDVARCDRNYYYFAKGLFSGGNPQATSLEQSLGGLCVSSLDISTNLYRLRTIMCTWIWQHMDTGYVQGMCDLLAPLLVVLEDEALTYACFCQLMKTMLDNFPLPSSASIIKAEVAAASGMLLPHLLETVTFERAPNRTYAFKRPKTKQQIMEEGNHHRGSNGHISYEGPETVIPSTGNTRINRQFESLRSLIEILDPVLAEHMHLSEDNSHLYFYRWLLLDFKREFKYADIFLAWETIWTSTRLVCQDFEIFLAFALIQYYRDIIMFYCFDYTDIIRFYNERAEHHDLPRLLHFARDLIYRLQTMIASNPAKTTRTHLKAVSDAH